MSEKDTNTHRIELLLPIV